MGVSLYHLLFAPLALVLLACGPAGSMQPPVAKNGTLDLRDWDFTRNGPVYLNGDWEYYWKEFLSPEDYTKRGPVDRPALVAVPGVWSSADSNAKTFAHTGYATYVLRLRLPETGPRLALRISDGPSSAYALYWDATLVAANGVVGKSSATELPRWSARTAGVEGGGEVLLTVQISNYHHQNGGFGVPVLLGNADEIFVLRDRSRAASAFLAGALVSMGLYHLGLYLYRKKDRGALWFALMCLVVTLRVLTTEERLLFSVFPWLESFWEVSVKLEYLGFYAAVPAMGLLFRALFPDYFSRRFVRVILGIGVPACLIVVFFPVMIFSFTLSLYQIFIIVVSVYGLFLLARAAWHRQSGAKLLLFGMSVFFVTVANDIVYHSVYMGLGFLLPAGLFCFTFTHAAVLGRLVARAHNTSEELSAGLEIKVAERTRELAAQRDRTEQARAEAEAAKQKSDALLLNILPAEVAQELKEHGRVAPQFFASATVLFTDFVGFTRIAEETPAADLVEALHAYFSSFDAVLARYGVEKLKTIGDSYMCAGGIPVARESHALDVCMVALELQKIMRDLGSERTARNLPAYALRIGVHTGPVTAGVIGKEKFAYDVWGDAVNTASRMESSGVPGTINISGATYELVREAFECEYRGKIEAKGKGEIDMYFLLAKKAGTIAPA